MEKLHVAPGSAAGSSVGSGFVHVNRNPSLDSAFLSRMGTPTGWTSCPRWWWGVWEGGSARKVSLDWCFPFCPGHGGVAVLWLSPM